MTYYLRSSLAGTYNDELSIFDAMALIWNRYILSLVTLVISFCSELYQNSSILKIFHCLAKLRSAFIVEYSHLFDNLLNYTTIQN